MRWPADKDAILDAYQRDGFVIIRQFLDPARVDSVRSRIRRYIDEIVPHVPPMDVFFEDAEARRDIRMLPRMGAHDGYFGDLLNEGTIPEVATALRGGPVLPHDLAYFNKLPRIGERTPPHQDGYYFHLTPCEAMTLWLSLDEVDEENGCIRYVRGSHRQGMRDHQRTEVLGFSQGIEDYGNESDLMNEVLARTSPGDLIAHHALTIHRAGPNQSNRQRRALGFVYFCANAIVDRESSVKYQLDLANALKAKGKI